MDVLPPRPSAAAPSEKSQSETLVRANRFPFYEDPYFRRQGYCSIGLIFGSVDITYDSTPQASYTKLTAEVLRKAGDEGGDIVVFDDSGFLADGLGYQTRFGVVMRRADNASCPSLHPTRTYQECETTINGKALDHGTSNTGTASAPPPSKYNPPTSLPSSFGVSPTGHTVNRPQSF